MKNEHVSLSGKAQGKRSHVTTNKVRNVRKVKMLTDAVKWQVFMNKVNEGVSKLFMERHIPWTSAGSPEFSADLKIIYD